ncbi:MAG: ATP-binding protein [Opitutaceae bacterium]
MAAALAALSAPVSGFDGYPIISSYAAPDIGIDFKIWPMVHDLDGTYRFGTRGLASFDGRHWDITSMRDKYPLRGLDIGPDGRIWAGATDELGWFEDHAGSLRYHSLVSALPASEREPGPIYFAFAEQNGAVFVTPRKVLRWTGQEFKVWPMPGTRRLFASRSDGTIYVHHKPTGVMAMRENGPELVIPASELGDEGVFWLQRLPRDWLLVTSRGLMLWSPGNLRPLDTQTNAAIVQAILMSVADLHDGRLALATNREGVLIVDHEGKIVQRVSEAEGLPTRNVYRVFLDRDRQLWGTSASHIFRINLDSPSRVFNRTAGLPAGRIHHLAVNGGKAFAVVNEDLFTKSEDSRSFATQSGNNEIAYVVRATPSGVFFGTLRGINRIEGTTVTRVYTGNRDVFLIEPSRVAPNHLLISEASDVKEISPDGTATMRASGLPDFVTSIAEGDDGRLWLGTFSRGLIMVSNQGHYVTDAVRDQQGPVTIEGPSTAVDTDEGDILVFARTGAWLKSRGATVFTAIQDFPRREILGVSPTHTRSGLWVALARSGAQPPMFGKIVFEGGRASWRPHAVDGIETIGAPQSLVAEPLADGTTALWIGGNNGVLRHLVAAGPRTEQPRAPSLHTLARAGAGATWATVTGALPYSTESIEFRFAAPQIAVRPTQRLETRIVGLDSDWIPAGTSSRREFTAVRDGRYTFEVRTVADTGVASAVTRATIEILPPWWRTWPAALGAVLALAPAIYGLYRWRVRTLERRNASLENKVRQRTAELEAANAAKTQFVANMSHDIRNPLNGIVGLALGLEDTRLEPRQREMVATLRECTTYLSTLVDDVLDFASIEAGRIELRPARFSPAELLRSVVATTLADAASRGARLTIDVPPGFPAAVVGDAGRIQQILMNFVSNALKYAGGEIRLSVALPDQAPGEVEFFVQDRGPGIRPEDRAALFKKFSRLEPSRVGMLIEGRGLGLAACRLLADHMGGAVGIDTPAGGGARFFLRLPLNLAAAPDTALTPAPALPNTAVLLVEDTDYNAWAATAVLARLGLTCERAHTGAEAIALFGAKRFNIVLLDRNLPDMDGTEVARQIRQMETEGQSALLLAVTAYCTAADRQLCLDAGMNAFVGKPVTPEKLRKVFLNAGRRQLAAAAAPLPAPANEEPLDLRLIGYLADGTPGGMHAEIERFTAALRAVEGRLTSAAAAADSTELGAAAHQLLGHAKMIGAADLADAARNLATAARTATDPRTCQQPLADVRRAIEAVTESMNRRQPALLPA